MNQTPQANPSSDSSSFTSNNERNIPNNDQNHHYNQSRSRRNDSRGYSTTSFDHAADDYVRNHNQDGGYRNMDRERGYPVSHSGNFQRYNSKNTSDAEWKCLECRSYNHSHDIYCYRCETKRSQSDDNYYDRSERRNYEQGDRYDENNERMKRSRGDSYPTHMPSSSHHIYDSQEDRDYDRQNDYYRDRNRRPRMDSRDHYYSRNDGDYDDYDCHDSRDRKKNRRSSSHHYRDNDRPDDSMILPRKSEWPSPFEVSGASYVFDARSGFFYEASSDFFYDPKTKYYYGNEKKKYFLHYPDEEPPFKEVGGQSADTSGDGSKPDVTSGIPGNGNIDEGFLSSGQDLVVQALQGSATLSKLIGGKSATEGASSGKKSDRKKIAISLKSKSLSNVGKSPSSSKPTNAVSSAATDMINVDNPIITSSKVQKSHESDMAKWSVRKEELREKTVSDLPNDEKKPQSEEDNKVDAVKLTVTGKPICTLCKRKFADIEKLKQHEKLSTLHKENLAKQQQQQQQLQSKVTVDQPKVSTTNKVNADPSSSSLPAMEYRDRAQERRCMYGSENASSAAIDQSIVDMGPSLTKARLVTSVETVTPKESLGSSNIGNQMLQKLGWKGGNLGRSNAGNEGNNGNGINNQDKESLSEKLKKDWERIESIVGRR